MKSKSKTQHPNVTMGWHNMHLWHIGYYVPLDAAATEEDVYALHHYTNLRPMWGRRLAKNATLPEEHELPAGLHPKVRAVWSRAKNRAAS